MKNYIYSILFLTLFITISNGQGLSCNSATQLCTSSGSITFPNIINSTSSQNGLDYGCLASHSNKQWFFIKVENSGNLNFQISQQIQGSSGNFIDIDFIVWGPFSSPTCDSTDLNPSNQIDCSFSVAGVENFTLSNVLPNQYYTLLVTNFSNLPGNMTITQTNLGQPNSGTTNCDIQCYLSLGPDVNLCPNTEFTLTASISDATYQWSSSNEGILPFTSQSIVVSPSQTTTYTVVANKQGCIENATDSITVTVLPALIYQQPNNLIKCSSNGQATFNLNTVIPEILPNVDLNDFEFYFTLSELDAHQLTNVISNPSSYLATNSQTIYFSIIDNSINGGSCLYVGQFEVIVLPAENPVVTTSISNQTITVIANGNGIYQYQLDNGTIQNSNVFENVSIGNHTINVSSTNGCGSSTLNITITPLAPTAVSPQYFNTGATLQDVVVDGENISWYASATDKQNMAFSIPLPITTPLIDGNTYYATQTLSGIESLIRTPVLTYVSSLSNSDVVFANLNFFPNPVKNSLTISNESVIDSVEITSILGQNILSQKVNSLQTEIDLSKLSSGIYFVKVIAEGQEKTIKIMKE